MRNDVMVITNRIPIIKCKEGFVRQTTYRPDTATMDTPPQKHWWDDLPEVVEVKQNDIEEAKKKFQQAKEKYEAMTDVYEQKKLAEDNGKWMRSLISTGTFNDRIKALALIVQAGPFNTYGYLMQLLNHCQKKNKDEAELAIRATKELFQTYLMPPRVLYSFQQRDFTVATPFILTKYYFEHLIKNAYAQFIEILRKATMDQLEKFKVTIIKCASELVVTVPEQRSNMLSVVVNKMGDINGKTASKASYFVSEMLRKHEEVATDIIGAIRDVISRPNISATAVRRCLTALNSIKYSRKNPQQAEAMLSLLVVYFTSLFKEKNQDVRALQNVIIGMRKCTQYCKNFDEARKHLNELYKLARTAPLTRSIECISMLSEIDSTKRFMRLLYERIDDIHSMTSAKQLFYISLIRKTLLSDTSYEVIASFIKRLLINALTEEPPFICGVLSIISELLAKHKLLRTLFSSGSAFDDDEEHYNDIEIDDEGNKTVLNAKEKATVEYDMRKRDPQYTGAVKCKCYELDVLVHHYHPMVRAFALALVKGRVVKMDAEVWNSLGSKRLLDRFALKKLVKEDAAAEKDGHKKFDDDTKQKAPTLMVVNSDEFISLDRSDVPVDMRFFYDYYVDKHVEPGLRSVDDKEELNDVDGMSEDLEEDDDVVYGIGLQKPADDDDGPALEFDVEADKVVKGESAKPAATEEDLSEGEYDYNDIINHEGDELLGDEEEEVEDVSEMSIEEGNVIDEDDDVPSDA